MKPNVDTDRNHPYAMCVCEILVASGQLQTGCRCETLMSRPINLM